MVASRGRVVVAAVMCAGMALAGCSTPPKTEATSTPATPSAAATRQVDLARLGEIQGAFPSGFPANAQSGVRTNDAQRAASVGDFVSYGKSLTVETPACAVLLNPVKARAGADWTAVNSSESAEGPFVTVEVDDPVSASAALPGTGCDEFRFSVAGAVPDGTAHRLAAPKFDDAISYALRVDADVTNPGAPKPVLVEYFYVAILDGRTFVDIWARVPTDFVAEPALPDLLNRAVKAIRGS